MTTSDPRSGQKRGVSQGDGTPVSRDDVLIYMLFRALVKSIRWAGDEAGETLSDDDVAEGINMLMLEVADNLAKSLACEPAEVVGGLELDTRVNLAADRIGVARGDEQT